MLKSRIVAKTTIKIAIAQQQIAKIQNPMSFFSSIPVWGWFDIGFNLIVLVALGGETEIFLKWILPENIADLLPPQLKRKSLKKWFEWLLILGIAGEICCLPFSLLGTADAEKGAAQANERASTNELAVAILNSNSLAFKKELLPRVDVFSKSKFLQSLQGKRKAVVFIIYQSSESYDLAVQIRLSLISDGWTVPPPRPVSEEDVLAGEDNPFLKQGPLIDQAGAPAGVIAFATKHRWGPWEDDSDNRDDPKIYFPDALKAAGVPFTPVSRLNIKLAEGVVSIIIGDKNWPD